MLFVYVIAEIVRCILTCDLNNARHECTIMPVTINGKPSGFSSMSTHPGIVSGFGDDVSRRVRLQQGSQFVCRIQSAWNQVIKLTLGFPVRFTIAIGERHKFTALPPVKGCIESESLEADPRLHAHNKVGIEVSDVAHILAAVEFNPFTGGR